MLPRGWTAMDDALPSDCDVLIVGARVAGASLALLLGERGYRVALIDRTRFPSDTLSTHYLAPGGVGLLAQLGVLADVEAAGWRRITRSRACVGGAVFEGAMTPDDRYGLAPRRDLLDTILIQHAVRRACQDRGGALFAGLCADPGDVPAAVDPRRLPGQPPPADHGTGGGLCDSGFRPAVTDGG